MNDYLIGAAIALVGTLFGYAMGIARPYLDKRFNRTKKPQGGTTTP